MGALTQYREAALQISKAGSEIATAEQLANFRAAVDAEGNRLHARYADGGNRDRLDWLAKQFFGLSALTHTNLTAESVSIDISALDERIMNDSILRDLTLAEMQEAFKNGVFKEYGDYFGLTAVSMYGFLKGFIRSEKKAVATAIFHRRHEQAERDAQSRFFRELYEAEKDGKVKLPDFSANRINRQQAKKTYTDEELAAHREKVRRQAAEIRRQAGMEVDDE